MARAAGSRVVAGVVTFVASTGDSPLSHLFARPHGAPPLRRALPFLERPRHDPGVVAPSTPRPSSINGSPSAATSLSFPTRSSLSIFWQRQFRGPCSMFRSSHLLHPDTTKGAEVVAFITGADDAPLPHLLARPHKASSRQRALPVLEQPRHSAKVVAIVADTATHHCRILMFAGSHFRKKLLYLRIVYSIHKCAPKVGYSFESLNVKIHPNGI
ncbi:hypothetical protein TIFTF001_030179 [Ficus carica]|uniref:Uncharacterized protein n=1 Tax=Ficus carica TaxID=3494 RepID=A0AA88DX38_FICCA|nr:hypothetical protein TIFTF001_030179 [Ficus carica]